MKQVRPYPQVTITRKAARSLASGHPWVFEGEVVSLAPSPLDGTEATNGCLVDVVEQNGTWQGTGLLSQQSKIRVRIVSRNANDRFDEGFWRRRIEWAWRHRQTTMGTRALLGCAPDTDACRVVFSEADGLPGLTVDRYGQVLVAQVGTVGMELLRGQLYPLLIDVLREDGQDVRAIYERCDSPMREKEGLPLRKGWWNGTPTLDTRIVVQENGLSFDELAAKTKQEGGNNPVVSYFKADELSVGSQLLEKAQERAEVLQEVENAQEDLRNYPAEKTDDTVEALTNEVLK